MRLTKDHIPTTTEGVVCPNRLSPIILAPSRNPKQLYASAQIINLSRRQTSFSVSKHIQDDMEPSFLSSEPVPDVPSKITTTAERKALVVPHEECQYLDLIRHILNEGEHRPDRFV